MSDIEAIWLGNDALAVSVLPGVGAQIFNLVKRRSGFNFFCHNPRILPRSYPIDANFDNYFCRGATGSRRVNPAYITESSIQTWEDCGRSSGSVST